MNSQKHHQPAHTHTQREMIVPTVLTQSMLANDAVSKSQLLCCLQNYLLLDQSSSSRNL